MQRMRGQPEKVNCDAGRSRPLKKANNIRPRGKARGNRKNRLKNSQIDERLHDLARPQNHAEETTQPQHEVCNDKATKQARRGLTGIGRRGCKYYSLSYERPGLHVAVPSKKPLKRRPEDNNKIDLPSRWQWWVLRVYPSSHSDVSMSMPRFPFWCFDECWGRVSGSCWRTCSRRAEGLSMSRSRVSRQAAGRQAGRRGLTMQQPMDRPMEWH